MVFLGGMERQYFVQFRQPAGQVALEQRYTLGVALTLAMENDHRPQPIAYTVLYKAKHLAAGLLYRHAVQIQPRLNGVLPQTKLAVDAVLHAGTLPAQYVVGRQRVHIGRRERIRIPQWG